jgi:ferredoxin-NADP reductase
MRAALCCSYTLDGTPHSASRISMIAGGTGITPMLQVNP